MSEIKKTTAIGLREASPLTAEIVAALRTRWTDAPEAKALSTFTGQMLANIFDRLAPESVRNIGLARERGMDYLVDKHLGNGEGKIFVDLACGFSARGVLLAKAFPALTVIEIDLKNIIAQKKSPMRWKGLSSSCEASTISAIKRPPGFSPVRMWADA